MKTQHRGHTVQLSFGNCAQDIETSSCSLMEPNVSRAGGQAPAIAQFQSSKGQLSLILPQGCRSICQALVSLALPTWVLHKAVFQVSSKAAQGCTAKASNMAVLKRTSCSPHPTENSEGSTSPQESALLLLGGLSSPTMIIFTLVRASIECLGWEGLHMPHMRRSCGQKRHKLTHHHSLSVL